MKLYILDLGKIVMETANPVTGAGDADGGEKPAIPIHAFLIDGPAGKILFDTGCHPQAMNGAWSKEMCVNPYVAGEKENLLNRLAEIGVAPEEIGCVVASHLHLDHGGGIHLFPNAKVYVQAEELRTTMEAYRTNKLDVFHVPCDVENWLAADTKWEPVSLDEPMDLCPGVQLIDLKAGHSFGMLALLVELKCGTFLLVSDAAYSAAHYGPPAALSGAVEDEEGYFKAMETIRALEKAHHATVLFGHDMAQYQTLVKSGQGCYE